MKALRRFRYELARRGVGPVLAAGDRARGWWRRQWRQARPSTLYPQPESTRLLKQMSAVHYFAGRYA